MEIQIKVEGRRGCGYRKQGGLYLILDFPAFRVCGKLPHELRTCPTCGAGIKPSRGWTWIDAKAIFNKPCALGDCLIRCLLYDPPDRAGLVWIGEAFYKTPQAWTKEAIEMGISRRITAIPRGFEVGKTLVLVAHRKAIPKADNGKEEFAAAIFQAFVLCRIEYVVKDSDSEKKIKELVKRGITPVRVIRKEEQMAIDWNEHLQKNQKYFEREQKEEN
jgi:hypothetical protein